MKLISILFFFIIFVQTEYNDTLIKQLAKSSNLIVIGEVLEIKRSPNCWSGYVACVQHVKYKVISTLKGNLNKQSVDVGHYIVFGSLTSENNEPHLSKKFFYEGNQLILFLLPDKDSEYLLMKDLSLDKEKYLVFNENYGAILASSSNVNKIKNMIE